MAGVPLFVDAQASRIVQFADLVVWSAWRRYEHGGTRFFDKIVPRFDSEGGVIHGLARYHPPRAASYRQRTCPATGRFRSSRGETTTVGQAARPGAGQRSMESSGPREGLLAGLVPVGTEFIDHHFPHEEFLRFAGNGHRYFRHQSDETGNLVVRDVSLTEPADVFC